MLDINYIINNYDEVKKNIRNRKCQVNIDDLVDKHKQLKALKKGIEERKSIVNKLAKEIAKTSDRATLLQQGSQLKNEIQNLEQEYAVILKRFNKLMLLVPNKTSIDTPIGSDDNDNIVIREFGAPNKFDFIPLDHLVLGKKLDILDFEGGAKVAGSKFYFLKNEAVLLEMALIQFVMSLAVKSGYTILKTPDLAKEQILIGSGYTPRGKSSTIYRINDHDLCLIGTSEITVGGLHSNEVLKESVLPLKYVAKSHCFRTEAGGAGRINKGLYRVHQFSKVELYQFVKPEDSDSVLEDMVSFEESIYRALEIPYRVVRICTGGLGAPAYKKYDIEAWMPGIEGSGGYGEITSASNCTDFQARRLNIRYKQRETNKNIFVHTINGTAIALSRTLLALMENYQTSEGEIQIPIALQNIMGINKIRNKNN